MCGPGGMNPTGLASQHQLHKFANSLKNSPTVLTPMFHASCKKFSIKPKQPVTDVKTRWSSTYNMLRWAIQFRQPVDDVCQDRKFRYLEVKDEEWEAVTDLVDVLKVSIES